MRIVVKTVVLLVVLLIFGVVCPQDQNEINRSINYSAQPVEEGQKNCDQLEESYEKNVFPARKLIQNGNVKEALELYKMHIQCWHDKNVYIELGEFFESQNNYQLAEMSYKEAGDTEKIYQLNQKKLKTIKDLKADNFQQFNEIKSKYYYHKFQTNRFGAISLFILGSVSFSTGLALFIQDKAGGENSLSAQYTLMLGGLSIIGGGTAISNVASESLVISNGYKEIAEKYTGDNGYTLEEYYSNSGIQAKNRKEIAKSYETHGTVLIALSIPMFVIAIYGFVESEKYIYKKYENEDSGDSVSRQIEDDLLVTHIAQAHTLFPAVLLLTGGIKMLIKSSEYKQLSTEPSLLTFNSIAPIIDPVSKTYGVALGFSF